MRCHHEVPTRVATFGALGHCYRLWVCQGRERMAGQGKDGPKMISFQVRSDLRFCSCHESRRQVQDDIEFVCGDPRYQSPETLRALIAHLKGNATASLDRIWDLQNSKNWDLQT